MGVIIPNPTVETEDGATSVANVKKIEVTNGDLTDDGGRVVSIDTSGSGSSPGGVEFDIQLNDGAGALAGSHEFYFWPAGGQLHMGRTDTGSTADIYGNYNADDDGLSVQIHGINNDGSIRTSLVVAGEAGAVVPGIILSVSDGEKISLLTDAGNNIVLDSGNESLQLEHGAGDKVIIYEATQPVLKLESSSKAVELTCDENKKLKVDGAAATWIFDASSTSGAMTFPDGTTQATAATGGGGGGTDLTIFDPTTLDSGTSEAWSCYWPFQPTTQYGQPSNWYAQTPEGSSYGYPFIAQSTGAISGINVTVYSGGSDDPGVAIYSANSDGYPDELQGMGFPASNSTGAKRFTSFYETDGTTSTTISLTQGDMYWIMHGGRDGDTDLAMLAAQMSTNTMVPSYGSSFNANGAGYNPRGTVKFTLASGSSETAWTDIFPATWPSKAAIGTAGGSMNWSNSQSEGATVWFGVDSA